MSLSKQIIFPLNWNIFHRPRSKKHTRPYGRVNTKLISFRGEKLITIQFRSLKSVVVQIESQGPLTETYRFVDVSDKVDDDDEG